MPEVRELETRLANLRREIAEAARSGSTPSQILKLQMECCQLWAAFERYKYEQAPDLTATRH
jgi:hypothetical protein